MLYNLQPGIVVQCEMDIYAVPSAPPLICYNTHMKDFIEFLRTQGVVGLAIGFILGGAVSELVQALVTDLINPFVGVILGAAGGLQEAVLILGPIELAYGHFISTLIDFIIVAAVVFWGFKALRLEQLDAEK